MNNFKLWLTSFFVLLLFALPAYAQLGQYAGPLVFNVSVGNSQTVNWTLTNSGGVALNYQITQMAVTPIANVTTPTVKITPSSGVIPPYGQFALNVTVLMPSQNPVGLKWIGIAVALGVSNSSNGGAGGAIISAGVGKNFVIRSAPPKYNIPLIVGSIIAVIAIISGVYYYRITHTPQALKAAKQRAKEKAAQKLRELEEKYRQERLRLNAQRKGAKAPKAQRKARASKRASPRRASRKGTRKSSRRR